MQIDTTTEQAFTASSAPMTEQENSIAAALDSAEEIAPKSRAKSKPKKEKQQSPFSEIEPWHEPVDGQLLITDMMGVIRQHLALPEGSAEAISLWCIFTHALDAFYYSPRLFFSSPEKQCGKSTALKIIHKLVYSPLLAANISPAAVYRMVDGYKPTLLLDEADTYMEKNEDLRGVLNSGHDRETAQIVRCEGDKHEVKVFSTWACYAIAGIGRIPATLEDRSVIVHMRRRRQDEKLDKFRPDRAAHVEVLARQICRWVQDNLEALEAADPKLPKGLGDRAGDNWTPLFAIADTIGGVWPEQARQAAIALQSHDLTDDLSMGVQLLSDIQEVFADKVTDKLSSADLCQTLAAIEERPWSEYGWSKKPITTSQLAKQLKKYEIKPQTIRFGYDVAKGYRKEDFEEAWSRYLPSTDTSENAVTPLHVTKGYKIDHINQHCNGVTANPGSVACNGTGDSNMEVFIV